MSPDTGALGAGESGTFWLVAQQVFASEVGSSQAHYRDNDAIHCDSRDYAGSRDELWLSPVSVGALVVLLPKGRITPSEGHCDVGREEHPAPTTYRSAPHSRCRACYPIY